MKNNYFEIRDLLVAAIGGGRAISTSQSFAISSLARLLAGMAQGQATPELIEPTAKEAAEAYVAEKGFENSGGIIEEAFEAGARWALENKGGK